MFYRYPPSTNVLCDSLVRHNVWFCPRFISSAVDIILTSYGNLLTFTDDVISWQRKFDQKFFKVIYFFSDETQTGNLNTY